MSEREEIDFERTLERRARAIRTRSLVALTVGALMVAVAGFAVLGAIFAEAPPFLPALLFCGVIGVGTTSAGTFGLLSGASEAARNRARRIWFTGGAVGLGLVAAAVTAAASFIAGFFYVAAASEQDGSVLSAWVPALVVLVPSLPMSFAAWWAAVGLYARGASSAPWGPEQSRFRWRWGLASFGALTVAPTVGWLVFLMTQSS